MIPERNLMAACGLQNEQQRKWVANITDMMDEGPSVILRLEKILQAIICHPEPLLWFSGRRIELEMLMLKVINRVQAQRDMRTGILPCRSCENACMRYCARSVNES
ncbi:hypothetical protein DPMN_092816 [Dreissena polymorpha]|uniref:Uncharacterized protein n=1 Tax=Dreissena polymorpha TaxID=45954 RepID=A0A9D4L2V0_DREPO|nr:hypothetical protein DPMN_092816 [Dreissena polymorpha]